MKPIFFLALGLWAFFAFSGCADMIQSLRAENEEVERELDRDRDPGEEIYAGRPRVLQGLSANNTNNYEAGVKRQYSRRLSDRGVPDAGLDDPSAMPTYSPSGGRRYTRDDFRDKDPSENSLWDGQGQGNYLFAQNRKHELGDVVTVDVEKDLRRELQYQLWMTLPPEQRKIKRNPASATAAKDEVKNVASAAAGAAAAAPAAAKSAEERARDAAEEAAKSNIASAGKEDDLVRMEVVESLGNGMVRMVGQKRVVYKGVARVLEITSVVNSKDIDDTGRLKSSAFLDTQTQVVQ